MASGQLWSVNSQGGYFYSNQLSNELRMKVQPMCKFRQFCDGPANAFGKHRGQTFTWDVVLDVATQGGVLSETNTIPQTNYTIVQGTLTVTEWGQAVPWTGLVEDLGKFDVSMPTGRALKNDAIKAMDFGAWYQFQATPIHAIASSGTDTSSVTFYTNGTVTGTNTIAFSNLHLKTIVDQMKQGYNIPAYLGDDYYAIGRVTTLRPIKNNLEAIHTYTATGFDLIMKGEIGRYENTRFVEQTNIPGGVATNLVAPGPGTTFTAWAQGKSDWLFIFGEDTVMEGIAEPVQLRYAIPTDYGRSKGMAWYALLGFGLAHTTSMVSSGDVGRIVMWDSQA